jgi:hypothetical protein
MNFSSQKFASAPRYSRQKGNNNGRLLMNLLLSLVQPGYAARAAQMVKGLDLYPPNKRIGHPQILAPP